MSRLAQRIVAVGFLAFIWFPIIAVTTGSVEPKTIENRPLVERPRLSGPSLLHKTTYDDLNSYLTDRMPWRDAAIRKREQLSVELFRESAGDQVVIGNDGWLYLGQVVRYPCYPAPRLAQVRTDLAELTSLLQDAGKTLRILVPPQKETVYPEHLQDRDRRRSCIAQNTARLQHAMQKADPGYAPRLMAATKTDKGLYYSKDTHWNLRGATIGAGDLIDSIRPGLFDQSAYTLHPGAGYKSFDLARLEGLPRTGKADTVTVARSGITLVASENLKRAPGVVTLRQRRAGGPLIPDRTVVIHDSFGEALKALASPWFADVEWVALPERIGRASLAGVMRDAQRIVIELTERMVVNRLHEIITAAREAVGR